MCKSNSFKAMLLAAFVAVGVVAHCRADAVYDCFKVVPYSVNWHVECTLDGFTKAVDIAIDDNAHDGWRAGDHGSRGVCYLASASSGETVNADSFIAMEGLVEFTNQSDFIVAFVIGCENATTINGYFGWVRLAYEGGTIVIKGGALNTERGGSIVAGIEEPASDLEWRTVDRGDYLELTANCLPRDTVGRVVIPREIGGKPVTSIAEGAFSGCTLITSIQIPNSISNVGYKAFSGCSAITSLSIPSSVTNLGASACEGCWNLQSLSLHGPATIIENSVCGLPVLRSLEFGTSVRTISQGAVSRCTQLASLTIPGDVERIESGAFTECPMLTSVSVHWLTKADATSFPQGCEIVRYGIDHLPWRPYTEPPLTDAEMLQFVDIVGRDMLVGRSWIVWNTRPIDDTSLKGMDRTSVRLGLYPTSYTTYSGPNRYFYFGRPTIRIVEFNPANRTIRMKVDPPDGSYVAAMPMLEYFHLIGIRDFGRESQSEIEIPLVGASDGFAEYKSRNGFLTLNYAETDAQFFYLRVADE